MSALQKVINAVCFLFFTLSLTLGLTGIGYSVSPIKLSISGTSPDSGIIKTSTNFFAEKVAQLTKGQVVIEKFFGGVLGGEFEILELAGIGEVSIVMGSLGPSRYAPGYDPTVINFYFPDFGSIERYWGPANPIYDRIQKTLYEKGKLRHLVPINMGARAMTSNKPVKVPADFKGIKMRVPEIVEYVEIWKELGCLVTPLPGSEIFSALQTGVIDAQENALSNIVGRSMWEVQKYIIFTEHNRMAQHFTMSEVVWQKLSKEHQQAVQEAARLTGQEVNRMADELDKGYMKTLKEKGMTFINPDLPSIRKTARPAVDRLLGKLAQGVPAAAENAIKGGK
jgi:TRAP-type C4-dicarboxylate transport system substrate-binding protein